MKNTVYFIAMLLLLFGCKEDSPNAQSRPHNHEQNGQQDKDVADGNEPAHRFELLAAEDPEEVSEDVFLVGWIRASLSENDTEVQTIGVEMDEPDDIWFRFELAKQDINFDGYTDIGVHQYGGAKWGKLHWWLYNPETKRFYRNSFTEELSRLTHANFWTDPKTRQIKITKFDGAEIIEYTYQLVEGEFRLIGSTYIYQLVNGELRLVGPRHWCPPIGRLSDGRDTCLVLYNQEQNDQQDKIVADGNKHKEIPMK